MARANRDHIPGQVWHITYRCHKREFLLKFAKDRGRWLRWLFEAKRRYGLDILNYTVTSDQGTSRQVKGAGDHYKLREPEVAYNVHYGREMGCLRPKNTYFRGRNDSKSIG